jgi:hypothetical protein
VLQPIFNMGYKSQISFERQCHEWEATGPVAVALLHQNIHGNTLSQLCLVACRPSSRCRPMQRMASLHYLPPLPEFNLCTSAAHSFSHLLSYSCSRKNEP